MPSCPLVESQQCQRRGVFNGQAFKLKCDINDRGGENPFPEVCRFAGYYAAYYGLSVIDEKDNDGLITFIQPDGIEGHFKNGEWIGTPVPRPEGYVPENETFNHHFHRKSLEDGLANMLTEAEARIQHAQEWLDTNALPRLEHFLSEGLSTAVLAVLRATSTEPSTPDSIPQSAQETTIPDPRLPLKLPSFLVWSEGVTAQRVFANKLTKIATQYKPEHYELSALVLHPSKYRMIAETPVLNNRLVAIESLASKNGDEASAESKISMAIAEPGEGVPRQLIMIEDLALIFHPDIHPATREHILNLLSNQADPNCEQKNLSVIAFIDSTSPWLTDEARNRIAAVFPTADRQVQV